MANIGINLFNVDETVDRLMAYQYLRLNQMKLRQKAEQVEIGAYGTLRNLFNTFQGKLTSLTQAFEAVGLQASTSNSSVATATVADNSAAAGSHTIIVSTIARAQINTAGNSFASKTTAANINETLTFTNHINGSKHFSVTINTGDSLTTIRDNINNSGGNIGIKASIVASSAMDGTPQYNLILMSDSGTANQIDISGDTGNKFAFSETTSADDARFTFDGFNEVRSSNTVTDVMDGLTLNLIAAGTTVISVSGNESGVSSNIKSSIQDVLTNYNAIISFLDGNQMIAVYDDKNNQQANANNSAFPLIKMQLQSAMYTIFNGTGDIHSLKDVGIVNMGAQKVSDLYDAERTEIASYGGLKISTENDPSLNDTRLNWVLENDFSGMKEFFTSGLINNVNNIINKSITPTGSTGVISNATDAVTKEQQYSADQVDAEVKRLARVREGMVDQFARLNAVLSYYQNLSDSLDKQFSYLDSLARGHK